MNEPELITLSSDSDSSPDSCDTDVVPKPLSHPPLPKQQQPKEVQLGPLPNPKLNKNPIAVVIQSLKPDVTLTEVNQETIPTASTSLKTETERNGNGSSIPKRKRIKPSAVTTVQNGSNSDATSSSEKRPEVPSTSAYIKYGPPKKCSKLNHKSAESGPKAGPSSNNGENDLSAITSKYEAAMELIINKINKYDEEECDWDDEVNSSYLVKDRLVQRLMKLYTTFCQRIGCVPELTNRPVQKRFNLKEVTKYPELDSAVEQYLNTTYSSRQCRVDVAYAAPDYNNILDVVTKEIEVKKIPVIPADIHRIAQELFRHTVMLYKQRRILDLHIALPYLGTQSNSDPAEQDLELEKKLKENATKRRKEEEVLAEFALKQEQAGGDDSDEGDDEESEGETEEEEGDDEVKLLPNEPNLLQ